MIPHLSVKSLFLRKKNFLSEEGTGCRADSYCERSIISELSNLPHSQTGQLTGYGSNFHSEHKGLKIRGTEGSTD